jgi:FeS assembly protein IscX
MKWTWKDTAEIAHDLAQRFPDSDPLKIQPNELIRLVISLPTFADDPSTVVQETVEAIQAAWYDETQG